ALPSQRWTRTFPDSSPSPWRCPPPRRRRRRARARRTARCARWASTAVEQSPSRSRLPRHRASCLGNVRGIEHCVAGAARGIGGGKLRAHRGHLRPDAIERAFVLLVLVPCGKLLSHALERSAVPRVERIG